MKRKILAGINVVQKITSKQALLVKAIESLKISRPLSLIDVGSAKGIPQRWKPVKNVIFVYGFEPDSTARNLLPQNADFEGGGNTDSPFALSNRIENLNLNILKKASHSSALEPNMDLINRYKKRHPELWELDYEVGVEARDLDSVEVEAKDFMKIDVQGYELKVLQGAKESLSEILGVEAEVEFLEMYKGGCSFGEINDFLCSCEFEFVDFISLTRWERDSSKNTLGVCIGSDALFLRSPEYIRRNLSVDDEKLRIYLSVCLIYRRYDLLFTTLDLFDLADNPTYREFINASSALRRRLNAGDRVARIANHVTRFFVSDADATPMFY